MATASYKLERSPQSLIFRQVALVLQTDATLKRVVKSWRTWGPNGAGNLRAPAISEMPCVRLTPMSGPDQFWGPSAFSNVLVVMIECFIPGSDADDAFDLYWAMRRAIYPKDDAARAAIHRKLMELGGRAMFTARFSQPNFRPAPIPDSPYVAAAGMFQIDLIEDLNP